jgi:rhamnosyltransferase
MIAAVVVLYFPRHRDLDLLLRSVIDQVDMVILIDNTPRPVPEMESLAAEFSSRVSFFPLMDNLGIAAAQNIGIEHALVAEASHIVFFDQDSVPAAGMVRELLAAEISLRNQGVPLAAVGPVFIDERTGKTAPVVHYSYLGLRTITVKPSASAPIEAHFLIASGCLIRASALRIVGKMRDDLFIDWVDNEWGLRARSMGLRCYVVPRARMMHNVGDGSVRLLWKHIHLHSDTRNYYLLRNAIFLMRVRTMGSRWKLSFLPRLPCYLLLFPLLSKHKKENLRLIAKAMFDGLRGRMGRLERSEGQS